MEYATGDGELLIRLAYPWVQVSPRQQYRIFTIYDFILHFQLESDLRSVKSKKDFILVSCCN